MLLSILIPCTQKRIEELVRLKQELFSQIISCNVFDDVEIITDIDDGKMTIGQKRNNLLKKAKGNYVCFFDSDDKPASTYIHKILDCIKTGCDNCSMTGVITWDGQNPELFEHSIKYNQYRTNEKGDIKYERYPNHLNVIRTDIAKQFKFPEINHGEDTDFATQIFKSGLLKNETEIPGILYHYDYKTKK